MCRYGTGDLQRWPYNKVTIQVEGNHKESLSKERERWKRKTGVSTFQPVCSFNQSWQKEGRNCQSKSKSRPRSNLFLKGRIPQPQSTVECSQEQGKEWAQVMLVTGLSLGTPPVLLTNLLFDVGIRAAKVARGVSKPRRQSAAFSYPSNVEVLSRRWQASG